MCFLTKGTLEGGGGWAESSPPAGTASASSSGAVRSNGAMDFEIMGASLIVRQPTRCAADSKSVEMMHERPRRTQRGWSGGGKRGWAGGGGGVYADGGGGLLAGVEASPGLKGELLRRSG